MILSLLPLLAQVAAAPAPGPLSETRCMVIITDKDGTRMADTPQLHVLADTRAAGPYRPPIPAGAAVTCGRSSMVTAENDWKVLAAGHPLAIIDSTPGSDRLAWLELVKGRVHYQFTKGRLRPEEVDPTSDRMNAFQAKLSR